MALSDIAADIQLTAEQCDRGVAVLDRTGADLAKRLAPFAADLPCEPDAAATLVEAYAGGRSVGDAARAAGLTPVTGGKALYLLGEPIAPLGPTAREVIRDWLAAELSRADALELTGVSETEFALATFVETHDPLDGAGAAVASALDLDGDAAVEKREHLGETMSDVGDLY